jgi:hypothetical protein
VLLISRKRKFVFLPRSCYTLAAGAVVWLLWFWLWFWAALPLLSVARPLLLVARVTVRPSPGLAAVSGKYRRAGCCLPSPPLPGLPF